MGVDVLYIAKNRLEFTKASFTALVANTDWSLVNTLWIYDDGSTDGTREWLRSQRMPAMCTNIIDSHLGAPAEVMNDYMQRWTSAQRLASSTYIEMFAKIDNDVIVPPGWLNACMNVMHRCPTLDLLGIEHPYSRTPHYVGGPIPPRPELTAWEGSLYAPCDSIGGIGLMRRSAFVERGVLKPYSIYGGFTDWQLQHQDVKKGWIVPPLNTILLDRLPVEPWITLSHEYIAKGWQRAWSGYDPAVPFWGWWLPQYEPRKLRDLLPKQFDAVNACARLQNNGVCSAGHMRGQRGCALCEDLF